MVVYKFSVQLVFWILTWNCAVAENTYGASLAMNG